MTKLQENTFLREIPDNLLIDEKVKNLAQALQQSLNNMLDWSEKINYKMNLDLLDDAMLDHLLWESHITWSEGLSLVKSRQQKINLIRTAVDLHRIKGTPAALERVLQSLELPGEVIEWFQYDGDPYHFVVEIQITVIKGDTLTWLNRLIKTFKNVRSWLDEIRILFPRMQLNLKEFQWHYPVLYPIAGYHWTEGIKGAALESAMHIASEPYRYPVLYPIANDFNTDGVKGISFARDSELLQISAAMINPYPVCGEFYGGGY